MKFTVIAKDGRNARKLGTRVVTASNRDDAIKKARRSLFDRRVMSNVPVEWDVTEKK